MVHRLHNLGILKPADQWKDPGKPEWPDLITVVMSRSEALKLAEDLLRQVNAEGPPGSYVTLQLFGKTEIV